MAVLTVSPGGPVQTVTTTNDSGAGSLRQAILNANADTSTNAVSIRFNIPGAGVRTLAPFAALPALTRPVTLDGYTQPGASANTRATGSDAVLLIELSGTNAPGATGLFLTAGASGSVSQIPRGVEIVEVLLLPLCHDISFFSELFYVILFY